MNKYTELSDFEINKKVAISIGFSCYYGDGSYTSGGGLRAAIVRGKNHNGNFMLGGFDPCNNPADAMPIIIENNIDLLNGENMMPELFGHHSTYTLHNFNTPIAADSLKEDKTIYRLGMEAFLMKKDAENE
ncbi:MAG TPA: hypothetical protein DD649_11880 [Providencia sp.]|uniref:phage protein NinX family protein n=1 Tax=Providencia sp. TaxID=589 RepID=UPI000E89615F|nr:phage protein NinX family protein [Providencia sp.]HBO23574.1 hypothetical protein [Providencia sp.]